MKVNKNKILLLCSGGSGEERRQCRETLLHVQEPHEDPQQEEQTSQKMRLDIIIYTPTPHRSDCVSLPP